ncbi:MAG: LLM class flavin-dependent oxidoreductase [Solirubrobacteraceae bacterium]|nr:LLM class flavin-dependent oxidoreductase [Patulibacter sp.]
MVPRPLPFLIAVGLSDASPLPDAGRWRDRVLAAEAAGVDLVTIDAGDADAVLVAAGIAARTETIGVVPVAATTITEPFHVSTAVATVDQVSGGRAGWLAAVRPTDDAQGLVTWTVPDDVHADAAEHITAVRALWDSWEDGAEIRDAATSRFVDAGRVHHVDLRGPHLAVRGPSITPRPPQGHPPVFVRVRDHVDLELARDHADVLLVAGGVDAAPLRAPGLLQLLELDADAGVASRVAAAEAAGFDGVLVHAPESELALQALAPVLADRGGPGRIGDGSLRARLGLPPAKNRFAQARA